MKSNRISLALTFLIALTLRLSAEPLDVPSLKVGDPAPKMQPGEFVQGDPVTQFEKGKAYLLEFWAVWSQPSKDSVPRLNQIHQKYRDKNLVVIGQDFAERDESQVRPFVKSMGEKMAYRVALDDKRESKKGRMAETWMAAAGLIDVPCAFLVDTQGAIAWIGHPMNLKDETIDQVLANKFDLRTATAQYAKRLQNDLKIRAIWTEFGKAMKEKRWEDAMARIDDAQAALGADQSKNMDAVRFNVMLGKKDYPAAYKYASRLSDSHLEDATLQNELAWRIVTDAAIEKPDLELAQKFAERANAASKGKEPGILDTLARVKWLRGNQEEAVALEQSAVNLADASIKTQLQKVLESYKRGQLPKLD